MAENNWIKYWKKVNKKEVKGWYCFLNDKDNRRINNIKEAIKKIETERS